MINGHFESRFLINFFCIETKMYKKISAGQNLIHVPFIVNHHEKKVQLKVTACRYGVPSCHRTIADDGSLRWHDDTIVQWHDGVDQTHTGDVTKSGEPYRVSWVTMMTHSGKLRRCYGISPVVPSVIIMKYRERCAKNII